jgi:hypothetical protein
MKWTSIRRGKGAPQKMVPGTKLKEKVQKLVPGTKVPQLMPQKVVPQKMVPGTGGTAAASEAVGSTIFSTP